LPPLLGVQVLGIRLGAVRSVAPEPRVPSRHVEQARQAVDVRALLTRTSRATAGEIIVLSTAADRPTGDALDDIIAALADRGFALVTLDDFAGD